MPCRPRPISTGNRFDRALPVAALVGRMSGMPQAEAGTS